MKRVIALLLIMSMVMGLCGCSAIGMASAAGMPTEETQPEETTLMDSVEDLATKLLAAYLATKLEEWITDNLETEEVPPATAH